MKDFLNKIISTRESRAAKLREAIKAATAPDEVRSLGAELESVNEELRAARTQLDQLEAREQRGTEFQPFQAMSFAQAGPTQRSQANACTLEQRTAFRDYVTTGALSEHLTKRASTIQGVPDLGVVIPETIMSLVLHDLEGEHGKLYGKVRKLNIAGGVRYPVGTLDATFTRLSEGVSGDTAKGFKVTGSIVFGYKLGEIKLSQSIIAATVTLEKFEQEFARIITQTYLDAMDAEIQLGNGTTQMQGIFTVANADANAWTEITDPESRIKVVELSESDIADWKAWQTKVFAALPLEMRDERPEMVTTYVNWDSIFKTFSDTNNRPIATEGWTPDGLNVNRFRGVETTLVKPTTDGVADNAPGANIAMLWVPQKAYAINSNMQFSVRNYFDENTNSYVKKALVINDGRVLDPRMIMIVKRALV